MGWQIGLIILAVITVGIFSLALVQNRNSDEDDLGAEDSLSNHLANRRKKRSE